MPHGMSDPQMGADVQFEWLNVDEDNQGGYEAWILMTWEEGDEVRHGSQVISFDPYTESTQEVQARALESLRSI